MTSLEVRMDFMHSSQTGSTDGILISINFPPFLSNVLIDFNVCWLKCLTVGLDAFNPKALEVRVALAQKSALNSRIAIEIWSIKFFSYSCELVPEWSAGCLVREEQRDKLYIFHLLSKLEFLSIDYNAVKKMQLLESVGALKVPNKDHYRQ